MIIGDFMKLILDDFVNVDLKEYLLMQEGINDIEFDKNKFLTILNINYNNETTPETIMKYIESFQKNEYSTLFEFDKGTIGNFKKMKYTIEDMCCEYCYKCLVRDLFNNIKVKSVKTNFDYYK